MKALKLSLLAGIGAVSVSAAGTAALADPLSTPAIAPTLPANPKPVSFDVLGSKIYVSGQFAGLGLWQNNSIPGDKSSRADFTNAQVEVQKADGELQFYVQAGGYSLPSLGTPYIKGQDLPDLTYKWVPVYFLKFQPSANFNVQVGQLTTLVGAESTFTFQNINIDRGLLWNQEPAISRGVQANYTQGPWAVSVSWNDGYYSNRFTTGSALVTYTIGKKDTLAFDFQAQFKNTSRATFVTPLAQNNGQIYNLIWTHTEDKWQVIPYLQYSHTPKEESVGLPVSGETFGGAVLAKYSFTPAFSLAGRAEYISSSGDQNLLYGPGSNAWSVTLTPTYQFKTFFVRGEVSYTGLDSAAPGAGFGKDGSKDNQTRLMIELGALL